jgi:hypothetical protein
MSTGIGCAARKLQQTSDDEIQERLSFDRFPVVGKMLNLTSQFELDHIFLAVSKGGPEVEQLLAAGFLEGASNTHPGQGTACRRIFFENGYLELVWLEDFDAAASPLVAPTGLAARVGGQPGASGLGICLRLQHGALNDLPLRTWPYQAPYLPPGVAIPMAANSSLHHEPLLFFLPGNPQQRAFHRHANESRKITEVSVTLNADQGRSAELKWLAESGCLRTVAGRRESVMVVLDHGVQGGVLAVQTRTPLVVKW